MQKGSTPFYMISPLACCVSKVLQVMRRPHNPAQYVLPFT